MTFNSIVFIFFLLPTLLFAYYIIDNKYKNKLLLIYSFLFYAWAGADNLIIVSSLVIMNYFFIILQKRYISKKLKVIFIALNLFVLVYFKYIWYIFDNLNRYLNAEISFAEIIAPLGISFIIFHAISSQADAYKNENVRKVKFFEYALYLMYFPKIIQGPIVKFTDFFEQLNNHKPNFNHVVNGVELFIVGLAKKVIVADALGTTVVTVISTWESFGIDQFTAWLIVVCYFFQIYFDFSGYSDMAIGISEMLGYHIDKNFDFPYISKSITEFWRRWHISLGSWFKEYVYIPLGGNRTGNMYLHLLIVFLLTGVWHGAGVMYLIWGLMHGAFILGEKYLVRKGIYEDIPKWIRWLYTTIVVAAGWMIFLMPSGDQLISYLKTMMGLGIPNYIPFTIQYYLTDKLIFTLLIAIVGSYVGFSRIINFLRNKNDNSRIFNVIKYCTYLLILLYCLISIESGSYSPFIYFQF